MNEYERKISELKDRVSKLEKIINNPIGRKTSFDGCITNGKYDSWSKNLVRFRRSLDGENLFEVESESLEGKSLDGADLFEFENKGRSR